jgi:signal transduction histidine kinase
MKAVPTERLWRTAAVWERALDAALVLTLVVELTRVTSGIGNPAEGLLALVGCVTASLRRTAPITATAVLVVLAGAGALFDPTNMVGTWVAGQVGLFSVALRRERSVALALGALLASTMYAIIVVVQGLPWIDPTSLVVLVWTAAVVGAALTIRAQHDAVEAEAQRVVSLQEAQESLVARRLTEERVRIARDLHDSVAHGISAIALQTSAIEASLGEPDVARERLRAVRTTARAVLGETQQVLQLLREGGGAAGGASIGTVLDDARATGDDIDETLDPRLDAQPEATRVAMARVLREALTNARRHGRGRVTVRTAVERDTVSLVVVNQPATLPPTTHSQGFGLQGVRERAEAMGGHLEVHRSEHEFSLTVRLPRSEEGRR